MAKAHGRVSLGLLVFGLLLPAVLPAEEAKGGVQIVRHDAERRIDVVIDGQPFTSYIWPEVLTKPVLFPLRTERYELRPIAPAAGRWRGGLPIVRENRFLADGAMTTESDGTYEAPWGFAGGE